ncbi:hypothetical protein [Streptomyces sp. Ag109_O5-1]|nr:hypothetical protein [Streptomyces sp. Ag109_O5-1]
MAQQRGHLRGWNGDVSIDATGPLPPRIPHRGPRDVPAGRSPPADAG